MNSFDVAAQASATLNTTEVVSKNYADIGDTLTYTLSISNSGTADAINLIVTDLVPQGANFIANTVKINGNTQLGVDPALGINVGTIPISGSSTIVFNATVVTLPWSGNLTNYAQLDYQYVDPTTTPNTVTATLDSSSVVTTINTVLPGLTKTVDQTVLTGPGQILNYTLRINNGGNTTATNLVILDTIPDGTTFVPDSISIMGTPVAGTVAPPGGFTFGNLPANSYTTLSFQVTVNSIPANNKIINQGLITYNYTVDPLIPTTKNGGLLSNFVETTGVSADLSGIRKRVNKTYATTKDILIYTITVPNSGNTTAFNVVIVDTIPSGTTYVANSLTINGIPSANLPSSINVGTISAGAIATIQFSVQVN